MNKRQQSIKRAWPDALDLMLICVESGISMEAAMRRVAEEMANQSPELAEEMVLWTAELSFLQDRRTALENLGIQIGRAPGGESVCTSVWLLVGAVKLKKKN